MKLGQNFVKYFVRFLGQWSFKKKCFWDLLTFILYIFDFCCNKIQYVRDYMAIQVFDNAQLYVSTLAWPHFWSTLLQSSKYRFLLKQLSGSNSVLIYVEVTWIKVAKVKWKNVHNFVFKKSVICWLCSKSEVMLKHFVLCCLQHMWQKYN